MEMAYLDPREVAEGSKGDGDGGIDMGTRDMPRRKDDNHNSQSCSCRVPK